MGGVCCAGDPNAERGSWNAEHHGKPRGAARPCMAVPRSAFALPRSMKSPAGLPTPPEVLKIAQKLEASGYETWCVGGAIRDTLLELENHDFDLTTAAPPAEVRKLFKRTVPVGIEHGTVAVLDRHNRPHEVTTFRRDIKTDGRHAVVEFGVSLMDDLARRDFTINAIAYHPGRHEWRDPFHGADDLEHRLIRSVGDPNWRFQEDYPRVLRGLGFSAPVEVRIHPRTPEGPKGDGEGVGHLPAVRRWLSQVGEYADDLLVLPAARTSPISLLPKVVASIRAAKDPLTLQDLAVDGNDLIAAGVRPGPDVGEALERLLGEVLEDPSRNKKEYLLAHV